VRPADLAGAKIYVVFLFTIRYQLVDFCQHFVATRYFYTQGSIDLFPNSSHQT